MNRTLTKSEHASVSHRHRAVGIALLLLICVPAQMARAASMAEGNAAVRGGDFAGALAHYDAVRRESGDSALLAFNVGVAQFRLRMYTLAENSFAKASQTQTQTQTQRLAPRSFFNLGLVLRAQGRSKVGLGTTRAHRSS